MADNTAENPVALSGLGTEDAVKDTQSTAGGGSVSLLHGIRRSDRDMPENLHQVTVERCLNPTVGASEKVSYLCGSCSLVTLQLVVVMGVVMGALYPSCAQDSDCVDGFVCNNLPRGSDAENDRDHLGSPYKTCCPCKPEPHVRERVFDSSNPWEFRFAANFPIDAREACAALATSGDKINATGLGFYVNGIEGLGEPHGAIELAEFVAPFKACDRCFHAAKSGSGWNNGRNRCDVIAGKQSCCALKSLCSSGSVSDLYLTNKCSAQTPSIECGIRTWQRCY